jgi:type IVB pilus formation R64 PilN family outer membrane protein
MFKLEGLSTVATTSASSGRAGTSAAFSSDSKTTFSLDKQDPVAGMRTTIEALLTQGGRATVSGDDQTVVVTDTPEALARVAAYIEQANKAQARSVRLVVEAIEVVAKDNQDFGVDWNLVYSSLTSGAASSTGLARLASSQANALSLSPTSGRFKDSSVVLRALSDIGTVVSKRTFPLSTRSGRPVTQTLRTTFNYVDQVSAVTSTGLTTAAPAPTVTQKEETVGTVLTLIPKAMDNGQIFLNMSFDVSTNEPLTPFTVGSSSNGVTVQQKVINAHGALQEVSLRSGETVLLGGIDVTTAGQNQRRLAPGAPLVTGGSDQSSYRRSHIVIVVTAVAEDI